MSLAVSELKAAASFLRQAKGFVESVRDFFRGHNADAAARLGDISIRIEDEKEFVERLIAKAPNGGAS